MNVLSQADKKRNWALQWGGFVVVFLRRKQASMEKGAANHRSATEKQDWSFHYEKTRRPSENKRHYATNVQSIGRCVGGKRLVLQLRRNEYIKIFKTNCNTGNNCLPIGMEVANPALANPKGATPQMKWNCYQASAQQVWQVQLTFTMRKVK